MQLSLTGSSALFVMRTLRAEGVPLYAASRRTKLAPPDPAPLKRWGKTLFAQGRHPILGMLGGQTIEVAVPSGDSRIRTSMVKSAVYREGIPEGSFVKVGDGIVISGPELLFVEMAGRMHPVEHLMLGHELCGTFGRCADDPYNSAATYGLKPLTSRKRIAAFLDNAKSIRGIAAARTSLAFLNDNAWSPTESLIAAFLRLPVDSLGYGFGELTLNKRVERKRAMPGSLDSRVPDIMVNGTTVGLNYDGLVHLDLDSIADAGVELGKHPELRATEEQLRKTVAKVRKKALDDIRRNRELAAEGILAMPMLKEDLYEPGGFDQIVASVLDAIETRHGWDVRPQLRATQQKVLCKDRHRFMLSLLPGNAERNIKPGRYVAGHKASDAPSTITECLIEF